MSSDTKTLIELRKITQAGIIDCQAALSESRGDIEKAIEILRKKGALKAAKKADRTAHEGVIATAISQDRKTGAMAQIFCETDFVANNEDFMSFVKNIAGKGLDSVDMEHEFNNRKADLVIKIGENIVFGGAAKLSGACIASYLHSNKKVGVLVEFDKKVYEDFGHDIAMQIAAANPSYVAINDVPTEVLDKEKEIYAEQLKAENKPKNIIDKIVLGKLHKFYQEVCLLEQQFIKDDSMPVKKFIEDYEKKSGGAIQIKQFVRFRV